MREGSNASNHLLLKQYYIKRGQMVTRTSDCCCHGCLYPVRRIMYHRRMSEIS